MQLTATLPLIVVDVLDLLAHEAIPDSTKHSYAETSAAILVHLLTYNSPPHPHGTMTFLAQAAQKLVSCSAHTDRKSTHG